MRVYTNAFATRRKTRLRVRPVLLPSLLAGCLAIPVAGTASAAQCDDGNPLKHYGRTPPLPKAKASRRAKRGQAR